MRITVRLFAMLRERFGAAELVLELPDGATVAQACDVLAARHEALARPPRGTAFAVNREYATASTALNDGDELALIPPVSGG
jgi:molybdopterin synthase sulfur carrier subunit